MTQVLFKSFLDYDKFPKCSEPSCLFYLEIQNRFKCNNCDQLFCCDHRLNFKHNCSSLKKEILPIPKQQMYLQCSYEGCNCKLTHVNNFNCNLCNKKYCISHRFDFEHNCFNNHQMK